MYHLIAAAFAGAALAVAICRILWKRRMGQQDTPPGHVPPTELTEWDRLNMAYHEAGHAVCSRHLPEREPLLKITISPTDEAFGMIRTAPRPHHNETRVSFASTLAVMLAGRLAEERFLHLVTTSCVHDLAAARQLAADMVLTFGMGSRVGLTMPPPELNCGDALRARCDEDIQELLAEAVEVARATLAEHAEEVEELAKLLLGKGTLEQAEIDEFFGKRKITRGCSTAPRGGTTRG